MNRRRFLAGAAGSVGLGAWGLALADAVVPGRALKPPYPQIGAARRIDPGFDRLVEDGAPVEKIAEGFIWSEGPTWTPLFGGSVLFSDPRANALWRWNERDGLVLVLHPSGYDGAPNPMLVEPGSNGLMYRQGTVLMADSGGRAICRLDPTTGRKQVLASSFEGKRFNSPNDLIAGRDGTIYFTDPPYGLKDGPKSAARELDFCGVYRLAPTGELSVIDRTLALPNGIGLSPDEKTLYVGDFSGWYAYDLTAGEPGHRRRPFGVRDPGDFGPDGLTVGVDGSVWGSGPGGVNVFDASGKRLGMIEANDLISNNTFGADGYLYMTVNHALARVKVKAKGLA